MYCNVKDGGDLLSFVVGSNIGSQPVVLAGSTLPVLPTGTSVTQMNIVKPCQTHAMFFLCPGEKTSLLLLIRMDGAKAIAKESEKMSATELRGFHPFFLSGTSLMVTDAETKMAYVAGELPDVLALGWTYHRVSATSLCEFIVNRFAWAELELEVAETKRAGDEVTDLKSSLGWSQKEVQRVIFEREHLHLELARLKNEVSDEIQRIRNASIWFRRSVNQLLNTGVVGWITEVTGFGKRIRSIAATADSEAFMREVEVELKKSGARK